MNFIAYVEDPQGLTIPPANMVWSNAYRVLGTGPAISVTDLEVGTNVITLKITDSQGGFSSASVTVHVSDELKLPGPRLSATPIPIVWQVPGDSRAIVETNLQVSNAGGGALSFTATSTAPWLKVNGVASVTTNADTILKISADTFVLADLSNSAASIQLKNAADSSDIIIVPVNVYKGDLFGGQPISERRIFEDDFEMNEINR